MPAMNEESWSVVKDHWPQVLLAHIVTEGGEIRNASQITSYVVPI